MTDRETRAIARHYDRLAGSYDRALDMVERWLLGDWRAWAATQATGRVLEIAIGTGRTLPFYPEATTVIGLDLSAAMLERARSRARQSRVRVWLVRGDAQQLPIRDESVDCVVSLLSLCTIPDYRRALNEAHRVLRPGGRLVLVEHVRSPNAVIRAIQRALDPLTVRFAHDHLLREPLDLLPQLGFRIVVAERRSWGLVERVLATKASA